MWSIRSTQGGNTDIFTDRTSERGALDAADQCALDRDRAVLFARWQPDRVRKRPLAERSRFTSCPANGGEPRRISFGEGRYGTPVWSPRGDLIAFTKQNAGRFHIGVMRTDGSEERLLTASFLDEGPTWAPNGRVLMFTRETQGARRRLVALFGGYFRPQPEASPDAEGLRELGPVQWCPLLP